MAAPTPQPTGPALAASTLAADTAAPAVVAAGAAAADVDEEMASHWAKRDAAGLARTLRRAIELGRFTTLSQSLGMGVDQDANAEECRTKQFRCQLACLGGSTQTAS